MREAQGRGVHGHFSTWLGRLRMQEGWLFVVAFGRCTPSPEMDGPRGVDARTPHFRDEVCVAVQGEEWFVKGPARHRFGPGDLPLVPAGVGHRPEAFTDDLIAWVIFCGPDGGEQAGTGE